MTAPALADFLHGAFVDDLHTGGCDEVVVQFVLDVLDGERAHITLAYFGSNPAPEKFAGFVSFLMALDKAPVYARVVGKDLFGPNNDMPVLLVELPEAVRSAIVPFYAACAEPEGSWQKDAWALHGKQAEPKYHITLKHCPSIASLPVGAGLAVSGLQVKRLGGKNKPFFYVSVPR